MADPVVVSMYNVGFGDCFLIRIPGRDRERKVLIDCGSIKSGAAGSIDNVVERVIADVDEGSGPKIDVVAMSHRHKDHVSGFGNPAWQDVEVGEVWLPWIEDPKNEEARRILHEMASFALALENEVAALRATNPFSAAEDELIGHVLDNTLTLSNEKAMATLHRGFKAPAAKRRFLRRSKDPLPTNELDFEGITVHVLAPSDSTDVIREMNPPSDQSFLRVGGGTIGSGEDDLLPFEEIPPLVGEPSPDITGFLRTFAGESAIFGAVALEKAVNNTSLMLVLEVGEAVLLFPGDSQWGSWEINLKDQRTRGLMERTTFYKVGHHGSHNATPVDLVKDVINRPGGPSSHVWAATSVAEHGRFKEIPKLDLLDNLEDKIGVPHHVIRSDRVPPKPQWPEGFAVHRTRSNRVMRVDFEIPVN